MQSILFMLIIAEDTKLESNLIKLDQFNVRGGYTFKIAVIVF